MAGQKKDAQSSILRRVVNRTPLRPASLASFQLQALDPARFAARYFNREAGVMRRLLGIGGEFSPLHQTIGRNIVSRFTNFNRSFGPIQRALRPQPEHPKRRRPHPEAKQDYDGYAGEDFSYSLEPAFSEQPAPASFQYAQDDFATQSPTSVPWEGPLNSTPLPVARRIEFQPANLRYLTNQENPVTARPVEFAPNKVERISRPAAQPVERSFTPAIGQPALPGNSPSFQVSQPTENSRQQDNNAAFAAQVVPTSPPNYSTVEPVSDYGDAAYAPAFQPQAQPALSRALQRTFEAIASQPGVPGTAAGFNQASNLGASPAAVARHFAVPATLARYRAVKQAADKVFFGEQAAWEAEQSPAFSPQPVAQVFNPASAQRAAVENAPVQRAVVENALAQEVAQAPQVAAGLQLQEARRIQEETRALLETQQVVTPANPASQAQLLQPEPSQNQPSQVQASQVQASQAQFSQSQVSQSQPSRTRQEDVSFAQPASNGELPSVQPETAHPGNVQRVSESTLSTQPDKSTAAVSPTRANRTFGADQPPALPAEGVVRRIIQPEPAQPSRFFALNRPETSSALFDAAIPASLLENAPLANETASEVRRLTANRLDFPIRTSGWANNLAALRNNPGVEARATVARRLNEPENGAADATTSAWTDTGAGVYYDQRRIRRTMIDAGVDAVAAETQDRIFSLAETSTGLGNFQPQFMQGLAAEAVAPAQSPVNRVQPVAPLSAQAPNFTRSTIEPAVADNREIAKPAIPAVNRAFETTEPDAEVASEQVIAASEQGIAAPAQGQPGLNTRSTPSDIQPTPARDAASPGEAAPGELTHVKLGDAAIDHAASPGEAATGELAPAVSPERLLTNSAQTGQAGIQPEISDQFTQATALPGQAQRTIRTTGLQPTALQRVFKRLDLDGPGQTAFNETPGLDFGNMSFSYAARPGSRQQQQRQPDFEADGQPGFNTATYPATNFTGQPARETVYESVTRPYEPSVERIYTGPEAATPAPEVVGEPATRTVSPSLETGAAQVAGETGFEGQPVSSNQNVPGMPRTVSPVSGEVARFSQPQYLANSLEAAWLSPENRLMVERLPGGSGALQRLMQAPGQLQAFLGQTPVASASKLDLPSLRNNPGLSASVVRALEDSNINGSASLDGWSAGPALNFVQRRRAARQTQNGFGEFDSGAVTSEAFGFEQSLPNPINLSFASLVQSGQAQPGQAQPGQAQPGQAQPEVSRSITRTNQPGPTQRTIVAQPDNFQSSANRETASRIQRNSVTEPGQAAPASASFTISSDWVAQLQRRFEGFSVGQLSDSTGLIMRLLNNEGAGTPGSGFANFGTGQNFGVSPDFTYTVPPLLWRKVSNYAPQGDLSVKPSTFTRGQTNFTYTSPGEVLRAFEQGETYSGLPDEAVAPVKPGETAATRQDTSARLDLPLLQQTHRLLQRIASLEKTGTLLELAHRMDSRIDAAQTNGTAQRPAQPGTMPLSMPFAIQRQPETIARPASRVEEQSDNIAANPFDGQSNILSPNRFAGQSENRIGNLVERWVDNGSNAAHNVVTKSPANTHVERWVDSGSNATEAVASPPLPAPLNMADVPVNRPAASSRFLEVDPGLFADDDYARPIPAPEVRTIEVRVPEYRSNSTPLETAAARNGLNGPNIGQGEILQPLAIQRKASAGGPGQPASYAPLAQPALHNIIKTSVGRNLDHPIQRKMTDIFGAHFQDVRVHTGDEAAQATRHVGAEAFTLGSNIYFAPGRYQPESHAGQALIGHELTHVVQQSSLPSLGGGRIPETSSLGQSLEHHAIANEHLLLRHLSNNQDNHNHGFSSDDSGRLSYREDHPSSSYSGGAATVERSYKPLSEQNSHPPIKPSHIRTDSGSGSAVQRAVEINDFTASSSGGAVDVNDIISNQEDMDKLARKVYQIIRDKLIIERERGFGPGNGKFF